jgi:hypothetical protein
MKWGTDMFCILGKKIEMFASDPQNIKYEATWHRVVCFFYLIILSNWYCKWQSSFSKINFYVKTRENIILYLYCKWQSSFSKINFFMCQNKGKFIVFEKLDCHLHYQ